MAGELITGDQQIQWAGLLLGDGTPYTVTRVTGWSSRPPVSSGTSQRAQQHGARPGRLLSQARTIGIDLRLTGPNTNFPAVLQALEDATAIRQDEEPLVVQVAGRQLLVTARVTDRVIPNDLDFTACVPVVALLLEATDPRRYAVAEQTASSALPAPESGLSWGTPTETGLSWGTPVESGLSWGTPGSTGDITVTNPGNAEISPVIEFRGPVTTPALSFGNLRLEYDITLAASDVLVVDTWAGTVTLAGQDRLGTATLRSAPEGAFLLPPGATTTLNFRASPGSTNPAASATVRWRSAYW
ncbi:hypothetical protein [Kitasatospora sp. NPDC058046]|uniref:hypothetical protein n=1 Tax=Kitasatospora sp. NPDC058046 TaxID=3346312 RepID=UPI0036D94F45